jgi:hypothetical protein
MTRPTGTARYRSRGGIESTVYPWEIPDLLLGAYQRREENRVRRAAKNAHRVSDSMFHNDAAGDVRSD